MWVGGWGKEEEGVRVTRASKKKKVEDKHCGICREAQGLL